MPVLNRRDWWPGGVVGVVIVAVAKLRLVHYYY